MGEKDEVNDQENGLERKAHILKRARNIAELANTLDYLKDRWPAVRIRDQDVSCRGEQNKVSVFLFLFFFFFFSWKEITNQSDS